MGIVPLGTEFLNHMTDHDPRTPPLLPGLVGVWLYVLRSVSEGPRGTWPVSFQL